MEEEWSEAHNHNVQNSLQMATQKTDNTIKNKYKIKK